MIAVGDAEGPDIVGRHAVLDEEEHARAGDGGREVDRLPGADAGDGDRRIGPLAA